jgi:hypothetical protein
VSAGCCHGHAAPETDARRRRILWAALTINLGMFLFETGAGLTAGSVALQADALDFLADAANFAISLFLLGVPLKGRALAALAKGGVMGLFGLWLCGAMVWHALSSTVPVAPTMGAVGITALSRMEPCFSCLRLTAVTMPICVRCGSAPATMRLGISRSYWPPRACSERDAAGRTP